MDASLANILGIGKSLSGFQDPFILPSNESFPQSMDAMLELSVYLYHLNLQYQKATQRIVSHYLTDLDMDGDDDYEAKDELYEDLTTQLKLFSTLMHAGTNFFCYGNVFIRMYFPFARKLIDDRPGGHYAEYDIETLGGEVKFDFKSMTYEIDDPRQLAKGSSNPGRVSLRFKDEKLKDISRIRLRFIDPRRVILQTAHDSGRQRVIWRIEEWFVKAIKEGNLHQINETHSSILDAIKNEQDYLFNDDEVYILKNPTVVGLSNNDWGLPPPIAAYRNLHQIQVYRKIDESVGLDYMVPFRVFTPSFDGSFTPEMINGMSHRWTQEVKNMVARRRGDLFAMHAFPMPLKYDELGATGKQLTPKDLIEFETSNLLDGVGVPAELHRGSMSVETIPTTIRLFEASFQFLYEAFNGLVGWVADHLQDYLHRPRIKTVLQVPSMADDVEIRHIRMQLASAGEISRAKAFRFLGVKDPVAEAAERMEEDLSIEEVRAEKQQDFQRKMESGSMGDFIALQQQQAMEAGGMPPPGPGGAPVGVYGPESQQTITPLDLQAQAQEIAGQLLTMPPGERRKQLDAMRYTKPELHAMVKQKMDEIRNQGASEGRAMVQQPPQ